MTKTIDNIVDTIINNYEIQIENIADDHYAEVHRDTIFDAVIEEVEGTDICKYAVMDIIDDHIESIYAPTEAEILYDNSKDFRDIIDATVEAKVVVSNGQTFVGDLGDDAEEIKETFDLDWDDVFWLLDAKADEYAHSLKTHRILWTGIYVRDGQERTVDGNVFGVIAENFYDAKDKAEAGLQRIFDDRYGGMSMANKGYITNITPIKRG